jgi:flagellar biosynthesis repressor protein FlbT
MALKLSLKADERIIAGGAVLRNATGKTVDLVVENEVPLLREKDILSEVHADTPCKRVYFVIQLMYVDGQNVAKHQKIYWELVKDIIEAAPSTTAMFKTISESIYHGKYYQALKETRKLMQYEEKAMSHALQSGRHTHEAAEKRSE